MEKESSMSQVNFNSTSSITATDLGPSSSLQLMFAKLQLELSETAKSQAMERMESISDQQEEQKLVSALLNEARQAQADGKAGKGVGMTSISGTKVEGKDCYPMSQELADYVAGALGSDGLAVLLRNHGNFCCGRDIDAAMTAAAYVEEAAQVAYHAALLGQFHPLAEKDIQACKAILAAGRAV